MKDPLRMMKNPGKWGIHLLLVVFVTVFSLSAQSQERAVSGTVTGEDGETLIGVNILVKGTSNGTISDATGRYSISVGGDAVLVFSYVGYETQELTVGSRTSLDVTMAIDAQALEEVVVIGYGSQQVSKVSTAISKIDPSEFVAGNVRNIGEAIRGKVAGLSVTTASGNPNAQTEIRLRGITSIQGSSSPLVLIDGYPGSLDAISQNDVESIEILKDASASAIYGTRAANGVILITTKKSKGITKPVIEYSGYVSTGSFARTLDFLDAAGVREQIANGNILAGYDEGFETNWLDEVTDNPSGFYNNISMRGGTPTSNYVANVTYRNESGLMKGSTREEFIGRLEINQFLIDDKLEGNFRVLHGRRSNGIVNYGEAEGGSGADGFEGIYRQAIIRNPTDRILDDNGDWQERGILQYSNPVGRLEEEIHDNTSNYTWITGGFTYYPFEGEDFSIKAIGSQNQYNFDDGWYQTKQHFSTTSVGRNGLASVSSSKRVENYMDIYANYSKDINEHSFTGLLGYSYIDNTSEFMSITNYDFPSDLFSYHAIELGRALGENRTGSGVNTGKNDWTLVSFFGRVGYSFSNKYNVLVSLRQEGSSKFGDNNKWGLFPAVSAAWTLSNESFFDGIDPISNLKLRVGYGETGSVPGSSYLSLTSYAYSSNQFFFNNGEWQSILNPSRNPNPDLKWEVNKEYNIGLDFGLLDGKITGTLDYYNRTTEDLLFNFPVPVPPNLVGTTLANAAEMSNKGIEAAINYNYTNGDFTWTSGANFSRNVNELVSINKGDFEASDEFFFSGGTGPPIQQSTHRNEVGQPMGSFYGWKSVDIDANGEWIIENEAGELVAFADITGDDRTYLGNGQPTTFLAWNNYLTYGKWDFTITMRGAFDYQILNFARMFYENPNSQYNRLVSAFDPVYGKELLTSPLFYVSNYIEDGDHWKIDNVTLGYKINLSGFNGRVYGAVSNLAILTGYKGIDPEVRRNALSPGLDSRDSYPSIRTYTLGFNFTF